MAHIVEDSKKQEKLKIVDVINTQKTLTHTITLYLKKEDNTLLNDKDILIFSDEFDNKLEKEVNKRITQTLAKYSSIEDEKQREEKQKKELEKIDKWLDEQEKTKEDELQKFFSQNCNEYDFILNKPTFGVLKQASQLRLDDKDEFSITLKMGKAIFDACYTGNQGTLQQIEDLPELYNGLMIQAAELFTPVYVKKK